MAKLERIPISHLPAELAPHTALYENVQNAAFLQRQLFEGNSKFEYAFIDATTILSPNHVLAAVFRATNDYLNDRMKSKNVHSEIVFALSPNNNIAASFRTFGISPSTTSLLVVKLCTDPLITSEAVEEHLRANIEGEQVVFNEDNLARMTDVAKVRKAYKLGPRPTTAESAQSNEELRNMEVIVLGMMALRGAT